MVAPGEDAGDFCGELFVFYFFVVEEFGAFGGGVDDFGDLFVCTILVFCINV